MTPRNPQARAMIRELFLERRLAGYPEIIGPYHRGITISIKRLLRAAREWERDNQDETLPGVDPVKAAEWWSMVE